MDVFWIAVVIVLVVLTFGLIAACKKREGES